MKRKPPLIDTTEAADILGLTTGRVKQLCAEGHFGEKIGFAWVLERAAVARYKRSKRRRRKSS